jgi:betaine lipid synthase
MYATLAVAAGLLGLAMVLLNTYTKSILIFAWNCFLKPISKNSDARDQQAALESFYQGQASIYDITRSKLLQGRETM